MNLRTLVLAASVLLSLSVAPVIVAHDSDDHATPTADHSMAALHGQLVPAKDAPADWVEKERADYPLDSCVVSEDKLKGDMGGPIDYVYKQDGKPDRLVRFCCKDCIKDFKKNPNKYLSAIDAEAAKRKGAATHH